MRSLTRIVVVVGVTLGASHAARAATFEDTTVEALATASDLIVRGRVIAADPFPYGPGGLSGIHTRVVLQVEETLAGPASTIVVLWVHGGRVGDTLRIVEGQARFVVGEEVVVFLFLSPRGDLWPTGMARGKWLVVRGAGGVAAVPAAPLDGGANTHGTADPGVALSELAARARWARGRR